MKINTQLRTNTYSPANVFTKGKEPARAGVGPSGRAELKRMLFDAQNVTRDTYTFVGQKESSMISQSLSYAEKLRTQRQNVKDTSLEKKKLKYQFKDISSQIIRSKTSLSARQVVGQARRELLRLKQEKRSGKYDSEEIEAAINHAEAMERVARKKVRHLEEEEMLKASGGPCQDYVVEDEKEKENKEFNIEDLKEQSDDYISQGEMASEYMSDIDMAELFEEMQLSPEDMDMVMADMEDITSELMDEMAEGMRDMLEEMGLGDLEDTVPAHGADMDPEDLKMLKIKHRNKEMKEIVKADSEYLKAVFKHLAQQRMSGIGSPGIGAGGAAAPVANVSVSVAAPIAVALPSAGGEAEMPSIDVSI